MKRILVISPTNVFIAGRIREEAGVLGIDVQIMTSLDVAKQNILLLAESFDCLWVRFGYPYFEGVVRLAQAFDALGKRVVDVDWLSADVNVSKAWALDRLNAAGLPVPYSDYLENLPSDIMYPFVVKWVYGFKAKQVFLVKNEKELLDIKKEFEPTQLIWQEHIRADYEYKVITIGHKSLPRVIRYPVLPNGFRIDFYRGVTCSTAEAADAVRLAEEGSRVLGREAAKVDILQADGKLYVLEVNRAPGLEHGVEELLGENVVREVLRYLVR